MSTYAIKADKFFLPAGPQLGGYLMVEDGVFGAWQADEPSCEIKDYTGSWIAPGMVDTHIHGFYNHSTTDNDPEGIDISSTELARRGTTSWLPTTFTDGVEQIKDACAAIAQADEGRGPDFCGARIQGIYLEGPFFTMKHVGAQNPADRSIPPRRSSISGRRLRVVASLRAPWRPSATVLLLMRLL